MGGSVAASALISPANDGPVQIFSLCANMVSHSGGSLWDPLRQCSCGTKWAGMNALLGVFTVFLHSVRLVCDCFSWVYLYNGLAFFPPFFVFDGCSWSLGLRNTGEGLSHQGWKAPKASMGARSIRIAQQDLGSRGVLVPRLYTNCHWGIRLGGWEISLEYENYYMGEGGHGPRDVGLLARSAGNTFERSMMRA